MSAQELIEQLQKLNPRDEVAIKFPGGYRAIERVQPCSGPVARVGGVVIYAVITTGVYEATTLGD